MFKTTTFFLILLAGLISFQPVTHAQETNTVSLEIITVPSGADVLINNTSLGKTPLTLDLERGVYELQLELPEFEDWNETLVLASDIRLIRELESSDNLIRLVKRPIYATWAIDANIMRFQPYQVNDASTPFVTYDLDTQSLEANSLPLYWLEDDTLRNEYNIGLGNEPAFYSPSGRYIVHNSTKNEGLFTLIDTRTGNIIPTSLQVDMMQPSFHLDWSPDESTIRVWKDNSINCLFILIINGTTEEFCLRDFTDIETDMQIYTSEILSLPSNQQTVVVLGYKEDDANQKNLLWLVDLNTRTAQEIQIPGTFDAEFTADGEHIYVVHGNGVSKVSSENLEDIQIVTDVISSSWGVHDVSLSHTLDYALISARNNPLDMETYWIYTLPEENN